MAVRLSKNGSRSPLHDAEKVEPCDFSQFPSNSLSDLTESGFSTHRSERSRARRFDSRGETAYALHVLNTDFVRRCFERFSAAGGSTIRRYDLNGIAEVSSVVRSEILVKQD